MLKAKYYPQGKPIDSVPASDASRTWHAIEHGLELLKEGVIHRTGDGRDTRIWRDNWLPRTYGMKLVGSVRTCRSRWVSHLIDTTSNSWDETTLCIYFYPCDVAEILKLKLPQVVCKDLLLGIMRKPGCSVWSTYRLALQIHHDVGQMGSSSSSDQGRLL